MGVACHRVEHRGARQRLTVRLAGARLVAKGRQLGRESPGDPGAEPCERLVVSGIKQEILDRAQRDGHLAYDAIVIAAGDDVEHVQKRPDRLAPVGDERPLVAQHAELFTGGQLIQMRDQPLQQLGAQLLPIEPNLVGVRVAPDKLSGYVERHRRAALGEEVARLMHARVILVAHHQRHAPQLIVGLARANPREEAPLAQTQRRRAIGLF